jgi:hypothetical protein
MRPVAPRIPGTAEVTIAEDQLEFMPITAALVVNEDKSMTRVCRWTFTDEERSRIFLQGADIYFATPAELPLTPHSLSVSEVES